VSASAQDLDLLSVKPLLLFPYQLSWANSRSPLQKEIDTLSYNTAARSRWRPLSLEEPLVWNAVG